MFQFCHADPLHSYSFRIGELVYNLTCPTVQNISKKYGSFDNVNAHLFIAELANEVHPRIMDVPAKLLEESLRRFKVLVNSGSPDDSVITLLLGGTALFKKDLSVVPLSHHFPDFDGGNDYAAACDYFLNRFMTIAQSQHSRRQVYTHFADFSDEDPNNSVRFIMAAINDIIIQEGLSKVNKSNLEPMPPQLGG